MQAIGPDGTSAAELGQRLGVTRQAAAKHVETLERLGYVERSDDPVDARRRIVALTDRGRDSLRRSAAIFDELRAGWVAQVGDDRVRALEDDLGVLTAGQPVRVDVPGWFGG